MTVDLGRRSFLRASAVAGGGVAFQIFLNGCTEKPAETAATAEDEGFGRSNVWLKITPDRIVFTVAAAEMGQGVMTGLATLMCEELDLDPRKLELELAPGDRRFHSPGLPIQVTGGSETIRRYALPVRRAGAIVRAQLRRAAASQWRTWTSRVSTDDGRVIHADGRSATYNELADVAARIPIWFTPALKPQSSYKWMGKPTQRLDAEPKVFGTATFGMDVKIPDLRTAVVVRSPVLGGRVQSFDATEAWASPGVEDVVDLGHGVAVVARTYWHAQQGAKGVTVVWNEGPMAGVSSDDIRTSFAADVATGRGLTAHRPSWRLRAKLDAATTRRSGVYGMPYLAHATMEPMNCTARVTNDACEVWVGSQVPGLARKIAAEITGLPYSRVTVNSTFLGGGFGRRGRSDFVTEAVTLAQRTGKAIKLVWSREDDMRYGIFRPAAYHEIEGAVDASGELIGIVHKIACQSVYAYLAPEIANAMLPGVQELADLAGGLFEKYVDPTSVEGSADTDYRIPDLDVEYFPQRLDVPVGAWRSVGHSFNAYVMETFIDELAHAANRDPVEFRVGLLSSRARLRGVLQQVAAQAGWGTPLPAGVFRGVACHKSFESYAAAVAEITIEDGKIVPKRFVIGIDCGDVVNPDIVRAQLEGAVVFGLSAALKGRITFENGGVVESNYHDYEMVRMFEMPDVETSIVSSSAAPTGVGEPGVPVIAPAVANAVFAATGRRLRELPLSLD